MPCIACAFVCVAHITCGSHHRLSVDDFCAYGATSRPELQRCVYRTAPNDLRGFDTNAGRYGRGELDRCLSDAGPLCKDR